MRFAMASIAANLRSTCGSERKPPECSTQGFRAAQPQVGQGTESICLSVRSFLFIETDSDNALYKCANSLRRVQSAYCNRSSQIQKGGNHARFTQACQVYIRDCQDNRTERLPYRGLANISSTAALESPAVLDGVPRAITSEAQTRVVYFRAPGNGRTRQPDRRREKLG